MGAALKRIADYFLSLALILAVVVMLIVAEHDYSYNSAAFANSLALYVMWGIAIAGVWFNMVWESENDD